MKNFFHRSLLACALVSFVAGMVPTAASAAGGTQIVGRVLDSSGGLPIPGATVTLETGTTPVSNTKTDAGGQFTFANQPPGVYNLSVNANGYQITVSSDIFITPGQTQANVAIALTRTSTGLRTISSMRVGAQSSLQATATFNQNIDASTIQTYGYIRSGDALATLPFVNASTSSSLGDDLSISIRGYDPSETATLIDGHPVGPIGAFGQGYDYQLSPFYGIENMEVVYGSGATGLYAVPTVAGAINFETITPTRTPQFTAAQGFGSFGKAFSGIEATGTAGRLGYALAYGVQGTSGQLVGNPTQWNLLIDPSQCGPQVTDSLPSLKASDISACSYNVNGNYLLRNAVGKLTYNLTRTTNITATAYNGTMWAESSGNGDTDYVPYPTQNYLNPTAPGQDKETLPSGATVTCNNSYVVLNDSKAGYECMPAAQYNASFYGPAGGGIGRYHDGRQQDYNGRITQQLGPTQLVLDGYVDAYGFDNIKGLAPDANHYTDIYYTHGFLASDEYTTGRNDLMAGVFLEHQQHIGSNQGLVYTAPDQVDNPDLQLTFTNYFVRDTYTANSKLQIFGDLALQRDQNTATSYLNPRLSFMYRPTTNDVLRLTGGRSASVPDPSNLYGGLQWGAPQSYNPTCGSQLDSIGSGNNPALQPENAVDYEAAYGHRFAPRMVLQADLYSSTELNPLVAGTFPLSTVPTDQLPANLTDFVQKLQAHCGSSFDESHLGVTDLFNAGSAKYRGYTLDFTVPSGRDVTFDIGYAVQSAAYFGMNDDILVNNATLINGNQVNGIPLQRANLGIGWADPSGWSGSLETFYVGAPNGYNRPPYTYSNFNLAKQVSPQLTANFGVLNLFDSNSQQYGYIGQGVFHPENQFGSDTNSFEQGTEEFGLPLRQFWVSLQEKI